jgi:hypothetical protein
LNISEAEFPILSAEHPHAKLFERIDSPTFTGQGPALLDEAITESCVAHTAGNGPIGGEFVGLAAFKGHIALVRRLSGGALRRASIEYSADDNWAIVFQVMSASRDGQEWKSIHPVRRSSSARESPRRRCR